MESFQGVISLLKEELMANENVVAASVFGSLLSKEMWEQSDIDIFVITTEETERWEGVYTRREGVLVHFQVLSLHSLREVMANYPGGPFFAALASSELWFDDTGEFEAALLKAGVFASSQADHWACKEFCNGVQNLHAAEKYHTIGKEDDARQALIVALSNLAKARLAKGRVYPPRDIWSEERTAGGLEHTQVLKVMAGEALEPIIDAAWSNWRPLMAQFAAPILKAIETNGPVSMPELEENETLKRIEIPERLMDELCDQKLIQEGSAYHDALAVEQIVYLICR